MDALDKVLCDAAHQASLRLAEDGQSTMRARLMEAERKIGEAAQLRADNAELLRAAAGLQAERDADQTRIDALQHKLDNLQM